MHDFARLDVTTFGRCSTKARDACHSGRPCPRTTPTNKFGFDERLHASSDLGNDEELLRQHVCWTMSGPGPCAPVRSTASSARTAPWKVDADEDARGDHLPDSGTIEVAGKQLPFRHPVQAQPAGVPPSSGVQPPPGADDRQNIWLGRGAAATALGRSTPAACVATPGAVTGSVRGLRPAPVRKPLGRGPADRRDRQGRHLDAHVIRSTATAALADHEVELLYAIIRRLTDRGVGDRLRLPPLKEISTSAPPSPSSRTAAGRYPAAAELSTRPTWCG